jgi:hypothetical protein
MCSIALVSENNPSSNLTLEEDGLIVSVEEVEEVGLPGDLVCSDQESLTFSFKLSKLGEVNRVLSVKSISGVVDLEVIGKLFLLGVELLSVLLP